MSVDMSRASKRSKRAPCTAAASLPDEIMSEILLLLPSRSVLRFHAVCRSWATLFSSRGFTDAYAAKADARARLMDKFVFFAPSPSSPKRSTVAYSFSTRGTAADTLFTIDRVRVDFLCLSSRPCHGAMLFSDTRSGTYWVCNPSTGECIPLPKQLQRRRSLNKSSASLVYDDRSKERKVVHLFVDDDAMIRCEVYTLSSGGGRWRPAKGNLKLVGPANKFSEALITEDLVTKAPPVFANGCLHWLLYPNDRRDVAGRDAVLCFSVATETFRELNAPASVHVAEYMELDENLPAVPLHLAELEGSLALIHDLRRRGGQGSCCCCLDVWMLKDHAASQWSLDYRIDVTPLLARDYSPRYITLLGCSGGGGNKKKIMIATSQHQVHAYDPDTGEVQLVLSVPETASHNKEAPAGLWLGLYEDSLSRIGCESHQEKQSLSALTNILVRLPVKSIAQSMAVCRQWCSLIESESFVTKHISVERPKMRVLMATNGSGRRAFFDFVQVKDWLQDAAAGPAPLAHTLVGDNIICSKPCHGLNLLSTSKDDFLCNPCTGAIQCLGRRGKSHFSSSHANPSGNNAFSVGRSIGFGFDPSTGEYIVVEIGHIRGTLACMIKTSGEKQWRYIGKPPRPVTDIPPAHVEGTLYWMSEPAHDRALVTFDISTREFGMLPCEPCRNNEGCDAFLVELNKTLSVVVVDAREEEMDIWLMMHKHSSSSSSWVDAYKIRLDGQPDYSLKMGKVVMPVDMDGDDRRILLNTGRALGYYDTKTGALETMYSLDQLKLPESDLVFPFLCQDSLMRIQEDEIPSRVITPSVQECYYHPEAMMPGGGGARVLHPKCEGGACRNLGVVYRSCCRTLLCEICQRRCLQHSPRDMILGEPYMLPACPLDAMATLMTSWGSAALPFRHPSVPGPDYFYYDAIKKDDVVRHVFVSLDDYMRDRLLCRQVECGYRMEGQRVKETWVRRYLKL